MDKTVVYKLETDLLNERPHCAEAVAQLEEATATMQYLEEQLAPRPALPTDDHYQLRTLFIPHESCSQTAVQEAQLSKVVELSYNHPSQQQS